MMKNVLLIVVSILFITAASAQENRIKVACIGNSITYGYGLPDRTTQSYPADRIRYKMKRIRFLPLHVSASVRGG